MVMDALQAPDRPAYELIDEIGEYRIVRSRVSERLFISWYDLASRQTRRASLKTKKAGFATATVQGLVDRKVTGDPRPYLKKKQLTTVTELLDLHRA
jgi:hypothetical protein